MVYDVIIIGAGPAGMNAAVYSARSMLKTLIIGELEGGMMGEAHEICNFLSYKKILGSELAMKMKEHVESLGVEIKNERVEKITKNEIFTVKTSSNEYQARKIIYAAGSSKNKLELENESRLTGKGISYCATCDAAFYKNKITGVVGGSDAALTAALLLANYAEKVYIIYRQEKFFRAEPTWIKQVEENEKITCIFNATITELKGEEKLEAVKLSNGEELNMDGLFIEIGSTPNTELVKELGVELEEGRIKVDKYKRTNIKGLFAAGDVTNTPLKQVITAAADGAIAARKAFEEVKSEGGLK